METSIKNQKVLPPQKMKTEKLHSRVDPTQCKKEIIPEVWRLLELLCESSQTLKMRIDLLEDRLGSVTRQREDSDMKPECIGANCVLSSRLIAIVDLIQSSSSAIESLQDRLEI